ncbi:hypothetical protein GCM10009715_10690 [Paeniglutamicibacter psychrophenolicus]
MARATSTPYQRLGGPAGWGPEPWAESVLIDGDSIRLGTAGYEPIPANEPTGSFGGRTLPRGLAIGPDGEVLLADPARRVVLIHRHGTAGFTELWPAREVPVAHEHDPVPAPHPPQDPYTLLGPTDVGFAPNGDLVILDAAAGRVLVLAYPSARLRHLLADPHWTPTALAFDAANRAYIADPLAGSIDRFDARWRRAPGFPHPSTTLGSPLQLAAVAGPHRGGCRCAGGCGPDCRCVDGASTGAGHDPHPVLAVLDGERVLLLDDRGRVLPGAQLPRLDPGPLQRTAGGLLTWEDPRHPELEPIEFPQLATTRDGRDPERGLALLAVPRRVALPRSGLLRIGPLDGQRPGFAWDRLVLRASIPERTLLLVDTLASDSLLEPALLDSSAPWSRVLSLEAGSVPELEVQSMPGRHLWIRIEFRGDGEATAALAGLDIHGPRHGSASRLPASYQQDSQSAHFLERFLGYFDTVFAEVEAEHRDVARLLDPRTVPAGAALDWLGSWFGLVFDPAWGEAVRREAIGAAMDYAAERGTVAGVRRILQWHTGLGDGLPAVIEHFRVDAANPPHIGRLPLDATPTAHACTIVLPLAVAGSAAKREALAGLLAGHLPAHVRASVRYIRPGIVVGRQSCVGVDTLLDALPDTSLGSGALGEDAATAAGPDQTEHSMTRSTPC